MTPTEKQLLNILKGVSLSLETIESIVLDSLDPRDARLQTLHAMNLTLVALIEALQAPEPLSPPSQPDKAATAPAGNANQAAPEFASHAVGDRIETLHGLTGSILEIDNTGTATMKMDDGTFCCHDLCALKNLSRQEGGAK